MKDLIPGTPKLGYPRTTTTGSDPGRGTWIRIKQFARPPMDNESNATVLIQELIDQLRDIQTELNRSPLRTRVEEIEIALNQMSSRHRSLSGTVRSTRDSLSLWLRCQELGAQVRAEVAAALRRSQSLGSRVRASFDSTCKVCGQSICKGSDLVVPTLSKKQPQWVHEGCAFGSGSRDHFSV